MTDRMTARRRRVPTAAWARSGVAVIVVVVLTLALGGCTAAGPPAWTFAPPAPGALAGPPSPGPERSASPKPPPSVPPPRPLLPRPVVAGPARLAVPILYYHRVIDPPRGFGHWTSARRRHFLAYDVLPGAFEAQLDWLMAHHYTTILPSDLAATWDRGAPLPDHPVIITFDDGTHDWTTTVLPLLRERGMVAEFYVTLQALRSGGMSWSELRALAAAGNGIGSHGLHHRQLTGFGRSRSPAGEVAMRREVERSRDLIATNLGIAPDSYAYVGGGQDSTLRRLVREAGYTTARSILRGHAQDVSRRYLLRVIRIGSGLDVSNVVKGTLVPGLPGFARLLLGPDSPP